MPSPWCCSLSRMGMREQQTQQFLISLILKYRGVSEQRTSCGMPQYKQQATAPPAPLCRILRRSIAGPCTRLGTGAGKIHHASSREYRRPAESCRVKTAAGRDDKNIRVEKKSGTFEPAAKARGPGGRRRQRPEQQQFRPSVAAGAIVRQDRYQA